MNESYKEELVHSLITPYPEYPCMVNIAECIRNLMHKTYIIANSNAFDVGWLAACEKYILKLPKEDKYILKSYSKHGDELINAALRGNDWRNVHKIIFALGLEFAAPQIFRAFNVPTHDFIDNESHTLSTNGIEQFKTLIRDNEKYLQDNEFIKSCMLEYVKDLMRIINNAPKLKKPILTFRGVKQDYAKHTPKDPVKMQGFQSSSYMPEIADTFRDCCIYEIILTPGTPCIALESISHVRREREILIGIGLPARISEQTNKMFFDSTHLFYEKNGEKYVFTEPDYIFDKIFNPWNENTDKVSVRRIVMNPPEQRSTPLPIVKLTKYTRRRKMIGAAYDSYKLDNGVLVEPLQHESSMREKKATYDALKVFGDDGFDLKKMGIDPKEIEKLNDIPYEELDNVVIEKSFTRKMRK